MNIVKWILARPLIAIWVLGAIAILLSVASGDKKLEAVSGTHDIKSETIKAKEIKKKAVQHDVSSKKTLSETKTVPEMQGEEVHVETETPTVIQVTTEHNGKSNYNLEPFSSNTIEDVKNNQPSKKVAVIAEDLGQLEIDELLLMAREAYWNNGLDEAAQIYQQLIIREPQVIEHKGELGNVYWRQGYPKKAAELYSEIAIPLIESGSSERVSNMVGFIQLFYPDRVEVIMDRLERSNKNK